MYRCKRLRFSRREQMAGPPKYLDISVAVVNRKCDPEEVDHMDFANMNLFSIKVELKYYSGIGLRKLRIPFARNELDRLVCVPHEIEVETEVQVEPSGGRGQEWSLISVEEGPKMLLGTLKVGVVVHLFFSACGRYSTHCLAVDGVVVSSEQWHLQLIQSLDIEHPRHQIGNQPLIHITSHPSSSSILHTTRYAVTWRPQYLVRAPRIWGPIQASMSGSKRPSSATTCPSGL